MAITTMQEQEPSSISSTLEVLKENRRFEGDPVSGESADLTGTLPHEEFEETAMSGHPATESEVPETETEKEPDSGEDKRKKIKVLDQRMTEIARAFNKLYDIKLGELRSQRKGRAIYLKAMGVRS